MKVKVDDPFEATAKYGGCTGEYPIAWWSSTNSGIESNNGQGQPFEDLRNALYIPTLQKDGQPVPKEVIDGFIADAKNLGLNCVNIAMGMWELTGSGRVQIEKIWIASDLALSADKDAIRCLAINIKSRVNQDGVTYEIGGTLYFV